MPEDTLEQIEAKRQAWNKVQEDQASKQQELRSDLFVGAFFALKTQENAERVPLTEDLNRLSQGLSPRSNLIEIVRALAKRYSFFHWPLAFPEVFAHGGFDVVLGNPPWEKLQTEELQFFAARNPEIASLKGAKRKSAIKALQETDPALAAAWHEQRRIDAATIGFIRNSGLYPLTGVGKCNTFALFAEKNRQLISRQGRAGFIIQSDIATGDTYQNFFASLLQEKQLVSFYDFVNTEGLFPHIHRTHPHFCLITLSGRPIHEGTDFAFWSTNVQHLSEPNRHFRLSASDLALLNPNTLTCPIFRSQRDADLTNSIYKRIPIFLNTAKPEQNIYKPQVWRLLNTTDDSKDFVGFNLEHKDKLVPVIEAKTIHQFDHRFATFPTGSDDAVEIPAEAKASPNLKSLARYYVTDRLFRGRMPEPLRDKRWFLTARNITNSTNERTAIAAIIPRGASCEHTPYIETIGGAQVVTFLAGLLNSFVLDYVTRQKIGGTTLSYFILYQLPILFPYSDLAIPLHFFVSRVLELTYTAYDLKGLAEDCGYTGEPFRWDAERRFLLRCELDAAYFHLYGIAHDDVDYIMETFPIVKRKDEAQFSEYRTKRVILDIYNAMQQAITTGEPYCTRLDPPPADTRVAHKAKIIST